jgi:DNA-binding NarL/FixJ family response regulator
MLPSVRVAIADPHPAMREGITSYLKREATDTEVVVSVPTGADLQARASNIDVVLLDLCLSDDDALTYVPALQDGGARVLIYTAEDRLVPLRRAIEAGAAGVLLKTDPLETLPTAIADVIAGEFVCSPALAHALLDDGPVMPNLSERQIQVLRAIDEGLDRRATARVLGISEGVVKTHLARIREKYQQHGIEPGNSHHLTHLASADGYLR